uniref:Uncharacterized protein n=1 Tax=Amphimedon queenslandica TaxID=400682 RepID=A0A1X7USS0_AMPQE
MKKSNSTSMISDFLHHHHGNGEERGVGRSGGGERGSHIGAGLQGRRLPGDIPPLASPLPLSRVNSPTSRQHRVEQLRKEESVDERVREVEQDREVTSQIHLNQSCVELKIDCDDDSRGGEMMMETLPSVAITTTPFPSPSSPIYPSRVRSRSLTPTSPSSTRSFTWRSLSPVPMRPSSLCFELARKRKRNQGVEVEPSLVELIPWLVDLVVESTVNNQEDESHLLPEYYRYCWAFSRELKSFQ